MCSFHAYEEGESWSQANRIWCDLIHRGIVPQRLALTDRAEPWQYNTES